MVVATTIPGWFTTDSVRYSASTGNKVEAQVDGFSSFAEITRILRTATQPDHFIYIAGWWTQIDFELVPSDAGSTLRNLLATASQRGVQVRAILWSGHTLMATDNAKASTFINGLPGGGAILDKRHLNAGSHHQKMVIVQGTEGLLASCGGLDLDDNRLHSGPMLKGYPDGSPMHDVSCTISGPAAYDFVQTFLERWLDHPDGEGIDRQKGPLLGEMTKVPAPTGDLVVQVGHTYGNGEMHVGIPADTQLGGYKFAPSGRHTARDMILHAIDSTQRFIYMEDQYMVSEEIRDHLLAALPRIEHLTLLVTADDYVKGLF